MTPAERRNAGRQSGAVPAGDGRRPLVAASSALAADMTNQPTNASHIPLKAP